MSKLDFEKYYKATKEEYIKDGTELNVAKYWFKKLKKQFESQNYYAELSRFGEGLGLYELNYLKSLGWELISYSVSNFLIVFSIQTYYFKLIPISHKESRK